jgi:hypothetical protein
MGSDDEVCWWDFHQWVQPYLDELGDWPMVASPAWFDLDDTDPRKWAAVLSAAEHWTLRVETYQQTVGRPDPLAEASRAISAAENWPGHRRRDVTAPR